MKTTFTRAFCMALMMALCIGSLTAQPCDEYIVRGENEEEGRSLPINTYYNHSYTQQIFTASEMGFAESKGIVTSVSFQYINEDAHDRKDVRLYLANTTKSSYGTAGDWIPHSEFQLVYSGGLHLYNTGTDHWVNISLDSEFTYTGDNLALVVLDNEGSSPTGFSNTFMHHGAGEYRTLQYYIDGTTPIDPENLPASASIRWKARGNTKFEICKSPCNDYTVGNGTTATNNLPICLGFKHSYSQQIFDASELGFTGDYGAIKSVSFQYFYSNARDRKNISLYLANTSKDTFKSTTDWIPASELQLVYSGAWHLDNTGNDYWVTIPFDTEFMYTGNNIAIMVIDNEGNTDSNTVATFYRHEALANKSICYWGEEPIDPANPPTAKNVDKRRNNVKFEFCTSCNDYTVGNGTETTYALPIIANNPHSYTQQIFDASELGFAGNNGVINSVSFQYACSEAQTGNDFNLYLANTTKETFSSTNDWIPLSELQLVYSGNFNLTNTSGDKHWVTIPINSGFTYTGDNIAVVVLNNKGDNYSNSLKFYYHSTSIEKAAWCRRSTPIDPANPPKAEYVTTSRNNVKFEICETESPVVIDIEPPVVIDKAITVSTVTKTSIAISWTKATDDNTAQEDLVYWVFWNPGDRIFDTDIDSYTITGLTPDTEYYIYIEVADEAGNDGFYDGIKVRTLSGDVGTTDLQSPTEKIYPNPAKDYVIIESGEDIEYIAIFNPLGKKMYERANVCEKSLRIDVNNYASGIYFIKINDRTEKLVVQ